MSFKKQKVVNAKKEQDEAVKEAELDRLLEAEIDTKGGSVGFIFLSALVVGMGLSLLCWISTGKEVETTVPQPTTVAQEVKPTSAPAPTTVVSTEVNETVEEDGTIIKEEETKVDTGKSQVNVSTDINASGNANVTVNTTINVN